MHTGTDAKKTVHAAAWVRYFYQCFLIHFVLGMTVTAGLLLTGIALAAGAEEDGVREVLSAGVFDLRGAGGEPFPTLLRGDGSGALSAALYGKTVYGADPAAVRAAFARTAEPSAAADPGTYRPAAVRLPPETGDHGTEAPALRVTRDTLYTYEPPTAGSGTVGVIPRDLSQASAKTETNAGILFSDQTDYHPSGTEFLSRPYPIPVLSAAPVREGDAEDALPVSAVPEEPLVLIIHTHGTEAYAEDGAQAVPAGFTARSERTEDNVVAVGDVLAGRLEAAGIPVLHCRTMFDQPSYPAAYAASAAYVRKTVAEHPGIRYVLDVHRDALEDGQGNILRPVTVIGGEPAAQVMLVVGTDAAGADHHGWRDNLTVAVHLQDRLNALEPTFARPINLRSAGFNAQYAKGSLLLEIGASGNSLEEAKTAAYYLGGELAALITGA